MNTGQETSATADFYADPHVYDVLHRPGTRGEVRTLLRIAAKHLAKKSKLRILEPACGSGRYLLELARLGHRCAGFDLSHEMIDYANAAALELPRAARPHFFVARMEDFATRPMRQRGLAKTNGAHNNHADPCTSCTLPSPEGRGRGWGSREPKIAFDTPGDQEARAGARASFEKFDLAFNPINTIRHLTSDAAMLAHLACVRRALAPSGLYIVGLEVSDPALAQPTEDVWIGRTGDLRVQQNVSYLPPESGRKEAVISHLTITTGRGQRRLERHIDTRYHLRTYTRAQWDALLRRAGWTVLAAYGPSGRAKDTNRCTFGYFVWVLSPHR